MLAHSDGETLSIELPDQRDVRFLLNDQTRYKPERGPDQLSEFYVTDVVRVDSEVVMQRWRASVLRGQSVDVAQDDRRLSLVAAPARGFGPRYLTACAANVGDAIRGEWHDHRNAAIGWLCSRRTDLLEQCHVLKISHLSSAAPPGVQYLLHPLADQTIADRNVVAVPSEHEVELHHSSLQVGPVVLGKSRHLRRKAYTVGTDRLTQAGKTQLLYAQLLLGPASNNV